MKRISLILVLLAVGCVMLAQIGCQQQAEVSEGLAEAVAEPKEVEGRPAPKITFENVVRDFGEVGPSTKKTGEFKFTNTGEGPLKITRVDECCGIVTRYEKKEYAPGESGVLKVEWRSGSQPSLFRRELIVHTNDPTASTVTLTIKAETALKVACEPERLKLFLDEENAGCPEITITSLDDKPFSITGFKSTTDSVAVDYEPSVEATKFVFQPRVNMEKLQKNLKGRIDFTMTHPEGKMAMVLFDVLPKYTVTPPLLIVFEAQPLEPMVRKITVLNNYQKDFEIESVSSKGNTIAVKILEAKKINNGYQLDVELIPPEAKDKIRFTDVLSINIKGGEKLAITCNGYYERKKPKPKTE
jgi:hypothetical protein